MIKIFLGVVIGALIGLAGNYLCMITGGACSLMNNRIISIILWALVGGAPRGRAVLWGLGFASFEVK